MRLSVKLIVAMGLALGATPALAFTYVPSSATPSGQQFADPDAALESTASTLRDEVVTNNLRAQGGPLAGGAPGFSPWAQRERGYGFTPSSPQYVGSAPEAGGSTDDDGAAPTLFGVSPHP